MALRRGSPNPDRGAVARHIHLAEPIQNQPRTRPSGPDAIQNQPETRLSVAGFDAPRDTQDVREQLNPKANPVIIMKIGTRPAKYTTAVAGGGLEDSGLARRGLLQA